MDDLAAEVMRELTDCPEYWLKVMAAAYMREMELPIHDLALVTVELSDNETAYYFTEIDDDWRV